MPRINRDDGPEDGTLQDRCLTGGLPEIGPRLFGGSFRRIVQTPGGISMFYDFGQGHAWQRNIVMDGSPHLPANIRQWYGDSRGHWESSTLVIDVTNFSPKTDFQGSRENLHLVERWRRTAPTIEAELRDRGLPPELLDSLRNIPDDVLDWDEDPDPYRLKDVTPDPEGVLVPK